MSQLERKTLSIVNNVWQLLHAVLAFKENIIIGTVGGGGIEKVLKSRAHKDIGFLR